MLELRRKVFHIFFGTVFIFLALFIPSYILSVLSLVLLVLGVYLSEKGIGKFPILELFLGKMERTNEKETPGKAMLLYVLSIFILFLIDSFLGQKRMLVASLCMLTYADGFATIIGRKLGRYKLGKNKTYEGTMFFFLIAFIFLGTLYPQNIGMAFFITFLCTIVELLPIEDNLSVPISCYLFLYLSKFIL
jgi:dolichol kinase